MTEREAKKGNPFKDQVLDKLLGKKDLDRRSAVLLTGFERKHSSLQVSNENSDSVIHRDLSEPQRTNNLNEQKISKENKGMNEFSELDKPKQKNFRNFKSMTIDRMGKMLKFKSQDSNDRGSELTEKQNERDENETRTIFYPCNQASRKEKTNSLGRMLKLMDKDIKSKKMFSPSIFKSSNSSLKPQSAKQEKPKSDDPLRRAFSKMLSQIRGRSKSENTAAEPNIQSSEEKWKDFHPSRAPLASGIICSLSSSQSRLSPIKKSTPLTHDPTSSTSGIP